MPLQIRRGTTSQRLSITPLVSELVYDTTTKLVYVGDGITAGGVAIDQDSSPNLPLGQISDVVLDNVTDGDILRYDGENWVNTELSFSSLVGDDLITADIVGSVFADNSSLLVDGTDATINLNGTIVDDVIPRANNTVFLGSELFQFRELHVTGAGGVFIGDNVRLTSASGLNEMEMQSRLRIIDNQSVAPSLDLQNYGNLGSFPTLKFSKSKGTPQVPEAVVAGDTLFQLDFFGNDGDSLVSSTFIRTLADPEGVISPGIVPGKFEIWTTGDDGISRTRLVVDRAGRIISLGQLWATTTVPTGLPIQALVNSNVTSAGARAVLRRSRGTFEAPTSVQSGDNLFRLMWGGHDGTSYRDTASIEGNVAGAVSLGVIPSDLTIKTTTAAGALATAAKFTIDQTLQVNAVASLSGSSIEFKNTIAGDIKGSVFADDSTTIVDGTDGKITTPSITASSFVKFPIYNNPTARDSALSSPEAGMVVFLSDSTGSGGAPKLQVNTNGTTGGWVDL